MTTPAQNLTSRDKQNVWRGAGILGVVVLCALVGWAISGLMVQGASHPLWRIFSDAYKGMYYAQVGQPGEPRVYYVYGRDFSELQRQVELDPDIVSFEKTSLDKIALVSINADSPTTYKCVSDIPGVDGLMTIPLICH